MAAVAEPTYMLVDRGQGLEPPKKREDEPTAVSKLLQSFVDEVDKTVLAGEDAVEKARQAVFTARKRGSVQNLRAISSPPPPKADEE